MSPHLGTEHYAIDHKGRLAIPGSMRRATGARRSLDRFVLLAGLADGCLWLYDPDTFQETWGARLKKWQSGDEDRRAFAREFLRDARDVTVDSQGRVTIPPALMGRAGLAREAVLHGMYERIEIWSPERYQERQISDQRFRELSERFLREE